MCFDEIRKYASEQGIQFDPVRVTFAARWVGAGHEESQLPGVTVRIPVKSCGSTLALDMTSSCEITKSRGEGECAKTFPLNFH